MQGMLLFIRRMILFIECDNFLGNIPIKFHTFLKTLKVCAIIPMYIVGTHHCRCNYVSSVFGGIIFLFFVLCQFV